MLATVCSLIVGLGLGLVLDLVSGWLFGYAHVFVQLSVAIVTLAEWYYDYALSKLTIFLLTYLLTYLFRLLIR